MRPIKVQSRRWPRMRGTAKDEKEGEARKRAMETGKVNWKSAEYSRRRKRKAGRIGLKSLWRKSETEASIVIRGEENVYVHEQHPSQNGSPKRCDLLNPPTELEKKKHKFKRLVQSPNSFFMDDKSQGCFNITTVFRQSQAQAESNIIVYSGY
ncbi:40S ribosomal protein S27 [Hibiscus syriacus]|uniref:40S ribosomal protein S27 n=1 Tax=Hibiscus syriacus TaxID=106335 RepID=A0A6A2X841_HIBSY|nr:40S ribosomal protein S27 [Hibiscus syriacus]